MISRYTKLALLFILTYCLLYLFYFWQTPLGQMPVLDGSENFLLASQIASGSLPQEPFFRSMLYPALLSIPCMLGFEDELFCIASSIGILSHFISCLLLLLIVNNIWHNKKAALISCLLYGLYPPAVFFAAEPLDTTISITFMLGSLYFFFSAIDKNKKILFVLSGISLGVSALFRSNLLPFAIIYVAYPIIIIFLNKQSQSSNNNEITDSNPLLLKPNSKENCINSLIGLISFSSILLLGGIFCYIHSGEFRLLPWQGASNFYSANSLHANGKFYKHSIYIPNRQIGTNPARLEAELIYSKETGEKPPFNLNKFNKYWLNKSISEIKSNPSHWINLTLKKIYFLFNNYEQYNNKTFSFHKQITPILCYNPLCFGLLVILFLLASINLLLSYKTFYTSSHEGNISLETSALKLTKTIIIFAAIFTLSLGIIAFYVSARFRLPLASLLIAFSSYIFCLDKDKVINKHNIYIALFGILLSFSTFFNVADTSTYQDDRLLNAFACSRLVWDEEQILWADRVLKDDSHNLQAIRLKIVGFTNLVLSGMINNQEEWNTVTKEVEYLNKKNLYFNDTILLSGCYAWKFEKNKDKAYHLWTNGGAESIQPEFFQACLIYTGLIEPNESDKKIADLNPLLSVAINRQNNNNYNINNNPEIEKAKKALGFFLN